MTDPNIRPNRLIFNLGTRERTDLDISADYGEPALSSTLVNLVRTVGTVNIATTNRR